MLKTYKSKIIIIGKNRSQEDASNLRKKLLEIIKLFTSGTYSSAEEDF
jgi:uncharacterized membrane-anchored protein YitT (DUF2179 family)